jgi:hypothetical protein
MDDALTAVADIVVPFHSKDEVFVSACPFWNMIPVLLPPVTKIELGEVTVMLPTVRPKVTVLGVGPVNVKVVPETP